MYQTLLIGIVSGILFAILDALLNANPLAQRLLAVYKPIARTSINPIAGLAIDLVYGLAMAGIYTLLAPSLPGGTSLLQGLSFGLLAWFFRVVMYAASQWVMFKIPAKTLLYTLAAGLAEMLALGALYGIALPPAP